MGCMKRFLELLIPDSFFWIWMLFWIPFPFFTLAYAGSHGYEYYMFLYATIFYPITLLIGFNIAPFLSVGLEARKHLLFKKIENEGTGIRKRALLLTLYRQVLPWLFMTSLIGLTLFVELNHQLRLCVYVYDYFMAVRVLLFIGYLFFCTLMQKHDIIPTQKEMISTFYVGGKIYELRQNGNNYSITGYGNVGTFYLLINSIVVSVESPIFLIFGLVSLARCMFDKNYAEMVSNIGDFESNKEKKDENKFDLTIEMFKGWGIMCFVFMTLMSITWTTSYIAHYSSNQIEITMTKPQVVKTDDIYDYYENEVTFYIKGDDFVSCEFYYTTNFIPLNNYVNVRYENSIKKEDIGETLIMTTRLAKDSFIVPEENPIEFRFKSINYENCAITAKDFTKCLVVYPKIIAS